MDWSPRRVTFGGGLAALNALAVCFLALGTLSGVNLPGWAQRAAEAVRWDGDWYPALLGGACLLLAFNLVWLLRRMFIPRTRDHLTVYREDGGIRIGVGALEDPLQRAVMDHPGVEEARVQVLVDRRPGRPVRVVASAVFADRPGLPQDVEVMRQVLRRRFEELVQVEQPVYVYVRIRKIVRGDDRRRGAPSASSAPDPTYGAPRYPVEQD